MCSRAPKEKVDRTKAFSLNVSESVETFLPKVLTSLAIADLEEWMGFL